MSFETALEKVLDIEQGYANNPADRGGETYRGVARNRWPNWLGWEIVDKQKSLNDFPKSLETDDHVHQELNVLIRSFYKVNFWDTIFGDRLPSDIAEKVFDIAVNMGVERSVFFLQESLNVFNRDQRLYPDIHTDGRMGPNTIQAMQDFLIHDTTEYLLLAIKVKQGAFYLDIIKRDSTQETFARGWLKRLGL